MRIRDTKIQNFQKKTVEAILYRKHHNSTPRRFTHNIQYTFLPPPRVTILNLVISTLLQREGQKCDCTVQNSKHFAPQSATGREQPVFVR